jgi:hypothetical protein
MRLSWISVLVCAPLLAGLTGCGGSSNGTTSNGGGNPQTVAFTFTGGTLTAAAVATGTGTFSSTTLQSNALNVSVPSGTTDYSIAYVCPVSNGFTSEFVIAPGSLPSSVALSLPASWSANAPSATQFPSFTFNYPGFSGDATTAFEASMGWQPTATTFTGISMTSSANFQSGSTTVTIPDLTSIAGFPPAAVSGTSVSWQAIVAGGPTLPFASNTLTSGNFESVQNKGTYTEP